MTLLDALDHTISEHAPHVVDTGATDEQALTNLVSALEANKAAWTEVIDNKLIEWGKCPGQVLPDGIEMPSRETLELAVELATHLRNQEVPPPLRVVPNGESGIVFERRAGRIFETIEFLSDGDVEYAQFENSRLQVRQRLP